MEWSVPKNFCFLPPSRSAEALLPALNTKARVEFDLSVGQLDREYVFKFKQIRQTLLLLLLP
jgi:hypothetical protein